MATSRRSAGSSVTCARGRSGSGVCRRPQEEGVLVHNGDVIIDANDAALTLLGRTLAELVGRSAERLMEPADYAALRDTFECGKDPASRSLVPAAGRQPLPVRGFPAAWFPTGAAIAGILTFHDITGYRWIEEQLRGARQTGGGGKPDQFRTSWPSWARSLRAPLGGILEYDPAVIRKPELTDEQRGRLQSDPEIGRGHDRHPRRCPGSRPDRRGQAAGRRRRFRPDRSGRKTSSARWRRRQPPKESIWFRRWRPMSPAPYAAMPGGCVRCSPR